MTQNLQPAKPPTSIPLPGKTITLTPLDPSHAAPLWTQVGGSSPQKTKAWTYLPEGPYPDTEYTTFQSSVAQKSKSKDPLFYAIIDNKSQEVKGWISLMSIVPEHLRCEIGWVLFSPGLQRTTGATEAAFILLWYVFEELGYRRVEWKCNNLNEGSKRAAVRLGFTFEGVFREHMVVKGENRDTAWFSLLKREWEGAVREAFVGWLDAANFDGTGRQRRGLEAIRGEIAKGMGSGRR